MKRAEMEILWIAAVIIGTFTVADKIRTAYHSDGHLITILICCMTIFYLLGVKLFGGESK